MADGYILVKQSLNLNGSVKLVGAKNAVLPIMASLILTSGKSVLENVPNSSDVKQMINLLKDLGVQIVFDSEKNYLEVDTSQINNYEVKPEIMNKMRASILVMGPLLGRFCKAKVAMPGGCLIGSRPIDFHLKGLKKLGIKVEESEHFLNVHCDSNSNFNSKIVLEYPSVGATENIVMFAALRKGETTIVNAALEPEVLDFIDVLQKNGCKN